MVVNSEEKHKPNTMLEAIRDLVLDFVLYFANNFLSNNGKNVHEIPEIEVFF